MYATIQSLREISRRCLSQEPLSGEQITWLGKSLEGFLTHRHRTIEEAMGLRFPRGGVPWWLEEAIRKRDAALRELSRRHFNLQSVSAQARQIRTLAIRYAASAWRFDRDLDDPPERYAGTPNEWLWRAFASGAPMPVCERTLRHVLGH
jgi:hypothetical protein